MPIEMSGKLLVGHGAEQFVFGLCPPATLAKRLNLERSPSRPNHVNRAAKPVGNLLVGSRAQKADFGPSPSSGRGARFKHWNLQTHPLRPHITTSPAQPSRQFPVWHRAQQPDFSRSPAAWRRIQADTARLAHGNDFFNRALVPVGQCRIICFSESLQFTNCPGSAPTPVVDFPLSTHRTLLVAILCQLTGAEFVRQFTGGLNAILLRDHNLTACASV
jgi:hypothetical protein